VVVIDDVQRWYDTVESQGWDGLLKTNYRNIASVVAAASSEIGFSGGNTPEGFTTRVSILDLGMTEDERKTLHQLFYAQGKTLFSQELFDSVVGKVSDLTRFPQLSEQSSIPSKGKGPRYHLGLFRNLLQDLIARATERDKPQRAALMSMQDIDSFLRDSVKEGSNLANRIFGRAAANWTSDFRSAVRLFFIRGTYDSQPAQSRQNPPKKKKTKKQKTNAKAKADESKESVLPVWSLVSLGAVVKETSLGVATFVWTTRLAEQFFFYTAFPRRTHYPEGMEPKSPVDFVKMSVGLLEGHRLEQARQSSKDGHIIEHAMQELLFDVFTATAPVNWFFCAERHIEHKGQTGRIDFQLDDWGIELLVEGHGIQQHHQKASPDGKYGSDQLKCYVVVDARSGTKDARAAKPSNAAVVKAMASKPPNCLHLTIVFDQQFRTADILEFRDGSLKSVGAVQLK